MEPPDYRRLFFIMPCSSAKNHSPGIYAIDITEIDGFDNLHDPQEILKTEMERAAKLWGARKTWFSVNGSTCAMLVAISAAVPKGGRIHIERGCHMSVYHAAYLRELSLSYIDPNVEEAQAVSEIPEGTDAVVITSPRQMSSTKREPFSSSTKPTALTLASTHTFRNQPCVSVPILSRRAPTRLCPP